MLRNRILLSNSRYKFVYKPKTTGSYTVIASFTPADGDHLGNSVTKRFKVVN